MKGRRIWKKIVRRGGIIKEIMRGIGMSYEIKGRRRKKVVWRRSWD